jgi:hypothetical protein
MWISLASGHIVPKPHIFTSKFTGKNSIKFIVKPNFLATRSDTNILGAFFNINYWFRAFSHISFPHNRLYTRSIEPKKVFYNPPKMVPEFIPSEAIFIHFWSAPKVALQKAHKNLLPILQ